jgi:uncharacterized protein YutE (UPF0331/DUF86 family)
MVERDVVLAKVATIDRCLRRIKEARDPARGLEPQDAEDIVELNLLRAVQAAVDLAGHVVATEGLGLPAKLAENFTLLEREGVISTELADHLRRMAGYRNIAVHEYADVDPEVVESIVKDRLGDLRELSQRILSHFGIR